MVWCSHLLKNFPQFVVIHTVKGFSVVNEAEVDVLFWNSLAFSVIQWMSLLGLLAKIKCGPVGKESACNVGDPGLIPGSGRSSGEGNGSPLQYSCLETPIDRGSLQATVQGVVRVRHDLVTKPPMDVGNLVSGSSAFSKFSFNIWKLLVHMLLKPNLENCEHYFTSM